MKAWLGAVIAISQLASPALAWLPAAEQAAQAQADEGKPSQRELVLDRRRRQLVVLDDGMEVRRFSVAVGKPGWETPVGHFQVMELVVDPIWGASRYGPGDSSWGR